MIGWFALVAAGLFGIAFLTWLIDKYDPEGPTLGWNWAGIFYSLMGVVMLLGAFKVIPVEFFLPHPLH